MSEMKAIGSIYILHIRIASLYYVYSCRKKRLTRPSRLGLGETLIQSQNKTPTSRIMTLKTVQENKHSG